MRRHRDAATKNVAADERIGRSDGSQWMAGQSRREEFVGVY